MNTLSSDPIHAMVPEVPVASGVIPARKGLPGIKLSLWVVITVYIVASLCLLPAYVYQINPDGVSYISIAQKYLAGDFRGSINAYWSPLYSWMLTPFLLVGLPPLLASKVLSVLIAIAAFIAVWKLAENLSLSKDSRTSLSLTLIPIFLFMGFSGIAPDFLSTTVVLIYLAHLTKPDYLESRFSGAYSGFWGALGYLSKAYVMWFFLIHFLAACSTLFISHRTVKRNVVRVAVTGLVTFSVITGVWVALISQKYGKFTTASAGTYNFLVWGPHWQGPPGSMRAMQGNQCLPDEGFLLPPNPTAVSAWEDPTYIDIKKWKWSPFGSKAEFKHELKIIKNNLGNYILNFNLFSLLWSAIMAATVLVAGGRSDPPPVRPVLLLTLAVLVYPLGYWLRSVETRYLYPVPVLLLLLGFFAVENADWVRIGPVRRNAAVTVLCASFLPLPAWELIRSLGTGREIHEKAVTLADVVPVCSRVASDSHWGDALYLSFYNNYKYYGVPRSEADPSEVNDKLKKFKIDYFFVWDGPARYPLDAGWWSGRSPGWDGPARYPLEKGWSEVSHGLVPGLKIFRAPWYPGP